MATWTEWAAFSAKFLFNGLLESAGRYLPLKCA